MEKIDKDKINKKLSILKGDGGDVLFDEGGGGPILHSILHLKKEKMFKLRLYAY